MTKPSLPQGTRDFGPDIVRKRQFILNTIRGVFELYGFQPLETPAIENIETLMGKYGEEGDKLIFKILNNGLENPAKHQQAKEEFEKVLTGKNSKGITERALRYDLTIPFARYVAMNHSQLPMPYKRYQIQPVWRADRPQKGRYREFLQCDADVVGSRSLLNEVEFSNIYNKVFSDLNIQNYALKINSRSILTALSELCGGSDKLTDITTAIDKLDKIGIDKVKEELSARGLNASQIVIIQKYLQIAGTNQEKLDEAKKIFGNLESGKKGLEELIYVLENSGLDTSLQIDFTLARGLNYYTGIIFEAKAPAKVNIGSIGGGGRYDDLTGLFGVPNIPGVGISFGVDRIYDVMDELNLFPGGVQTGTQVLFFNLGAKESKTAFLLMQKLRTYGIRSELFHETTKLDKQFKYADKKNISLVVIVGAEEVAANTCIIKDLITGTQYPIEQSSMNEKINELLQGQPTPAKRYPLENTL